MEASGRAGGAGRAGTGRLTALRPALAGWRPLAGLVIAAGLAMLLAGRLAALDGSAVRAAFASVPPLAWALGAALTALSFAAIARQDETMHRHQATRADPAGARRAGFAAIALSQMAGFGLVSGTLVRWRMVPGLTLAGATALTLRVSLAFLAGWAVVAAGLVAILGPAGTQSAPGPAGGQGAAALALAAMLACGLMLALRRRPGGVTLRTLLRVLALTATDLVAAALAFWVLLPVPLPLSDVLPAVVIAIGAGLLSGAPGGIGAFELVLLALLPGVGEAALIAGILAWRLVYFVAPALIAAGLVLAGPGPRQGWRGRPEPVAGPQGPPAPPAFAEALLMRQRVLSPLAAGEAVWAAARLPQTLVCLSQPLRPLAPGALRHSCADLARQARDEARGLALYKATPRVAAAARAAGWAVVPLSREAVLDPRAFRLDLPACAGLRRKLRRAAEAGVHARAEAPPMAELALINAAWVAARGPEMGLSMGRFAPGYVAGQRIYVARQGARPVGFATFHCLPGDWALDLLRPHPTAPEGTAQALIAAALADAQRAGVARLSLAAVPEAAFADGTGPAAWATRWQGLGRHRRAQHRRGRALASAQGLWQFKAAFAPRWERRYLAAPGWPSLALAALDLHRAIHRPLPLPQEAPPPPAGATAAPPRAEFGFASARNAWHRKAG